MSMSPILIGIAGGTGSGKTSIAKQLKEVNELYQSGALTEEEFKEAKEQIINQ